MDQLAISQVDGDHGTSGPRRALATHQAEDAIFRRATPPFLLSTLALLVVAAILGPNMARWLFAGSALLVVSDLVLTVTRLGPLNRAIAVWTPVAPPADWRTVRGDWSRLHAARTGLVLVAALPSTTALAGVQSG